MAFIARSSLILTTPLLLVFHLQGQKRCGEEVKLILSPTQTHAAISSLQSREETHSRIYFYDTPNLDLLAKGVILRIREGAKMDVTAKLRLHSSDKFVDPSGVRGRYKCEMDLNDGVENPSVSLQIKYVGPTAPTTGEELFQILSEGQKKLLENSKSQIDWKLVKRVAEIQSTSWTSHASPQLGKLSLELWEWPSGSILEISTKTAQDAGQATYAELRALANKNGLLLSTNQRSKTATVLGELTASPQ